MLTLGERATIVRAFTAQDVADLTLLTGGLAGEPAAAGHLPDALPAALLSCLLGMHLPGHGTGWLKQTMHHHAPARVDEPLQAEAVVTRLRPLQRLVDLACQVTGQDGRTILTGRALMLLAPG